MRDEENKKQMLSRVGLAKKAGKLIAGADMVCDGLREGKIFTVITSADLSEHTAKRIFDRCRYYGVRLVVCQVSKEELGRAIGKSFTACVGITDRNLSELICCNL